MLDVEIIHRPSAQVFGGENKPFAIMMVLTSVYMVTELAVSLVTGCVSLARLYTLIG